MEINGWPRADIKQLSEIYTGFSHPARIGVLIAIENEANLQTVADTFDIQRPSLQDHIDKLLEIDLLYKPEDGKRGEYKITPLGQYYITRLKQEQNNILKALENIEKAETQIRNKLEKEKKEAEEKGLPIDEEKLERQINTRKWEKVENQFTKHLEQND